MLRSKTLRQKINEAADFLAKTSIDVDVKRIAAAAEEAGLNDRLEKIREERGVELASDSIGSSIISLGLLETDIFIVQLVYPERIDQFCRVSQFGRNILKLNHIPSNIKAAI
jgi:hypothetical protein